MLLIRVRFSPDYLFFGIGELFLVTMPMALPIAQLCLELAVVIKTFFLVGH